MFAFPGGYPIAYHTECGSTYCGECCDDWEDEEDPLVGAINWESKNLHCCDCGDLIESAY